MVLLVDEYEAIRLIDLEGLSQEECAQQMEVARSTVSAIYDSARKKIAQSIVGGRRLTIEGGNYRLCSEEERPHRHPVSYTHLDVYKRQAPAPAKSISGW